LTQKIAKFTCPECNEEFNFPQVLGRHRKAVHGIAGASHSAHFRQKKAQAKAVKCPECGETFKTPQALGLHKRNVHGIEGQHHSTVYAKRREMALRGELVSTIDPSNLLQCQECGLILGSKAGFSVHVNKNHPNYRAKRDAAAGTPELQPQPTTKRKYTRREIEQPTQAFAILTSQSNGLQHHTQEGHAAPDGIPEATLALALGRFQGFCTSMATEFDLPPRMFASRLATLIYRSQVR
jgi:uncharacterized C2H2 Zn-finger protein